MSSLPGLSGPSSPALRKAVPRHRRGHRKTHPLGDTSPTTDDGAKTSSRDRQALGSDLASLVDAPSIVATHLKDGLHARQLKAGIRILRLRRLEQRRLKRSSFYARLSPGSKQFDQKFSAPASLAAKTRPTCRSRAAVARVEFEVDAHFFHLSPEHFSK